MENLSITLEEVFRFWRANEAWNPKWQTVAQEKGFASWEDWRRKFLDRLSEMTQPEWTLERIDKPLEKVLGWYGGPFSGWIKNVYQEEKTMSFREIINQPFINGHDYIPGLVKNFPKLTVISVVEDSDGRVVVVEGMHRVCALALLAREGKPLESFVYICRGKLKKGAELSFDDIGCK